MALIGARPFMCGYCSTISGSNTGYYHDSNNWRIYICSNCGRPTFFEGFTQNPGIIFGNGVANISSKEVLNLYNEARACTGFKAYTASVLSCRKLLMHIAVDQGAQEGKTFMEYIEYLSNKGYVPPNGKHWVDHIRKKGNEANHAIKIMIEGDAKDLLNFIEMLLKFIYEFPGRIPKTIE